MAEWINGVQTSKTDIMFGTGASVFVPFVGITGGAGYIGATFSDAEIFLYPLWFGYGVALQWMYRITLDTVRMNMETIKNARQ